MVLPEESLTNQVVLALRNMPLSPDGQDAPRPSRKALNKTKKVLWEFETTKLPYPNIVASRMGIGLVWVSHSREVRLIIDQDGNMMFESSLKNYDETGALASTLQSGGPIEGIKGIEQMMVWYLSDVTAEA